MNSNNPSLIHAIRGPVMLITVGVLFALNQMTDLTFGKTWPALLIVLGLLSLGEHISGPKSGPPTSRRDPNFGGDQ